MNKLQNIIKIQRWWRQIIQTKFKFQIKTYVVLPTLSVDSKVRNDSLSYSLIKSKAGW